MNDYNLLPADISSTTTQWLAALFGRNARDCRVISIRAGSETNFIDLEYDLNVSYEVCSQASGHLAGVFPEKALYATVFQWKNLNVSSSATVSHSLASTDIFQEVSVKSFL